MLTDLLGGVVLGAQALKGARGLYKQVKGLGKKIKGVEERKAKESARRARKKLVDEGKMNRLKKNIAKDSNLTPEQINSIRETAMANVQKPVAKPVKRAVENITNPPIKPYIGGAPKIGKPDYRRKAWRPYAEEIRKRKLKKQHEKVNALLGNPEAKEEAKRKEYEEVARWAGLRD